MAEYIDREAAIKIAESYGLTNGSTLGRHSGIADEIAVQIASIPAADVVPVVHGRWLLDGRCSECLERPLTTHRNYCPNCGAKMDLQAGQKEEAPHGQTNHP